MLQRHRQPEKAGVSAITIHGRTREEFYLGKADWEIIKKVKESVSIPVIGNGDIVDEKSAYQMLEQTGVDGIMIGRGSFGNPWVFKEIITGEKYNKTVEEVKIMITKRKPGTDIMFKVWNARMSGAGLGVIA